MPPRLPALRGLLLRPSTTTSTTTTLARTTTRAFRTSPFSLDAATPTPVPVKKPVGAFRSGVFGFLAGSTLAGLGTWFYIMEEYRVSNELLTEDIYALQAAVQRIHSLVVNLEERLALAEMKNSKK